MRERHDTLRDAGKIQRLPHQQSDPDPLPEKEQRQVEQLQRQAVRQPAPTPRKH